MKKAECYNYKELDHIKKHCKKFKKNDKINSSDTEKKNYNNDDDDKKINKKIRRKKKFND